MKTALNLILAIGACVAGSNSGALAQQQTTINDPGADIIRRLPKAKEKPKAKPTPAARTSVSEVTIPDGAKRTEDGSYRYTDKGGKTWLYRKTPFGISKVEDAPAPVETAKTGASAEDRTMAYEDGESIRFERPGPFGTAKWTKKKTDLESSEQAVWDRVQKTSKAKVQ